MNEKLKKVKTYCKDYREQIELLVYTLVVGGVIGYSSYNRGWKRSEKQLDEFWHLVAKNKNEVLISFKDGCELSVKGLGPGIKL